MIKLNDLREHLLTRVDALRRNPDQLLTFVEDGQIIFHQGGNLSHKYVLPIRLIVTDWRYSADDLVLPILEWLSIREPGLDPENALGFESEIIDKQTVDVAFRIQVTERVVVTETEAGREIEHVLPGPPLEMNDDAEWQFDVQGPGGSFQEPSEQ